RTRKRRRVLLKNQPWLQKLQSTTILLVFDIEQWWHTLWASSCMRRECHMFKMIWCVIGVLILSGCSVHPLPEQVTRQSTLAIVTAIRCEAKQAVLESARSPVFDKGAIGYIFDF